MKLVTDTKELSTGKTSTAESKSFWRTRVNSGNLETENAFN